MQDITNQLRQLIAEQFNISQDRVPMHGRLRDTLPFDSLETVELVLAVENAFGVEIDDHDVASLETFDDVVACVGSSLDRSMSLMGACPA